MLSNARRITGISPDCSFALPGHYRNMRWESISPPWAWPGHPPDSLAHIRKTRSPILSAQGQNRKSVTTTRMSGVGGRADLIFGRLDVSS